MLPDHLSSSHTFPYLSPAVFLHMKNHRKNTCSFSSNPSKSNDVINFNPRQAATRTIPAFSVPWLKYCGTNHRPQDRLSVEKDKTGSFSYACILPLEAVPAIQFCLNSFLLYSASIVRLYHKSKPLSNYFYSLFEFIRRFSHFLCIPDKDTL